MSKPKGIAVTVLVLVSLVAVLVAVLYESGADARSKARAAEINSDIEKTFRRY